MQLTSYLKLLTFIFGYVLSSNNLFSFHVKDWQGNPILLSEKYANHIVLVVNVARQCMYVDDNYESLIPLQAKYKKDNLTVLAFPCNQFGGQEPGTNEEIQNFIQSHFNPNFPVLSKVNVLSGDNQEPIWKFITEEAEEPSWNYWKFLFNRNGHLSQYWSHEFRVRDIEPYIKQLIYDSKEL